MNVSSALRWSAVGLAVVLGAGAVKIDARKQSSLRNPPPPGQRLEARDGDTVIVEDDARVTILRRRHARVRAIFNSNQRWLILLASYSPPRGGDSSGRVDETFTFSGISGDWPLESRWEGDGVIEQYSIAGDGRGARGVAFGSPQGMVQLFGPPDEQHVLTDPAAVAVLSYRGFSRGGGGGVSFDEAEQRHVSLAIRNAETNARLPAGYRSTVTSAERSGGVVGGVTAEIGAAEGAPVRVGGTVAVPRKIFDVAPVTPEAARQADIRGTVILELTIGADGAVTSVRILRSIPLLDAAALECARQWRYDPVLLNGRPVPVIITATVTFP